MRLDVRQCQLPTASQGAHAQQEKGNQGPRLHDYHTGCFFQLVPPRKVLSMELVPPNSKKLLSTLVPPNFPTMTKLLSAVFQIIHSFLITVLQIIGNHGLLVVVV